MECEITEFKMIYYEQAYRLWERLPGIGLTEADSQEKIAYFLKRNPGLSFVAEDDGKLIGTIMCGNDGRRGYIHHLAVDTESRGRGIARKLVDNVLEALRKSDIGKCHCFVMADNETGNAFWEHTGWTRRKDLNMYSKLTDKE